MYYICGPEARISGYFLFSGVFYDPKQLASIGDPTEYVSGGPESTTLTRLLILHLRYGTLKYCRCQVELEEQVEVLQVLGGGTAGVNICIYVTSCSLYILLWLVKKYEFFMHYASCFPLMFCVDL